MTNREELINEDWGKEYSKLADLYAKKCKEVRELKDKNKQIRAEVIEEIYNDLTDISESAYVHEVLQEKIEKYKQLKEQK